MQLMERPSEPTDARQTIVRERNALRQHQTSDLWRVGDDRIDCLIGDLRARGQIQDPQMLELAHPVRRRRECLRERRLGRGRVRVERSVVRSRGGGRVSG